MQMFSYALQGNNANEPAALRSTLLAIVPYAFGDHTKCNAKWCGYLQRGAASYKHTGLLHGKNLTCPAMKSALDGIFSGLAEQADKLALWEAARSARRSITQSPARLLKLDITEEASRTTSEQLQRCYRKMKAKRTFLLSWLSASCRQAKLSSSLRRRKTKWQPEEELEFAPRKRNNADACSVRRGAGSKTHLSFAKVSPISLPVL